MNWKSWVFAAIHVFQSAALAGATSICRFADNASEASRCAISPHNETTYTPRRGGSTWGRFGPAAVSSRSGCGSGARSELGGTKENAGRLVRYSHYAALYGVTSYYLPSLPFRERS